MNENLKKLGSLLELVDTKSKIDEFVNAFAGIITFLQKSQNESSESFREAAMGLQMLLEQCKKALQEENVSEVKKIKLELTSALIDLRNQVQTALNTIHNSLDGKEGPVGPVGAIGPAGPMGAAGKDGSPDTGEQIVEKINGSEATIKKERVEGLLDAIRNIAHGVASVGITTAHFLKNGSFIGRAKNINFIEGSSATLNMYQTGDQMNVSISSTAGGGGTAVAEEVPTGSINGSNTAFTIAHTPLASTFKLYLNGAREQNGTDYTLSGTNITFTTAPLTGSILFVDYSY